MSDIYQTPQSSLEKDDSGNSHGVGLWKMGLLEIIVLMSVIQSARPGN